MSTPYPRELIGYGGKPPHPEWPGEARIAVNFVIHYEEGSEYNVHDDGFSEGVGDRPDVAAFKCRLTRRPRCPAPLTGMSRGGSLLARLRPGQRCFAATRADRRERNLCEGGPACTRRSPGET
jgi:hypothetical protein